MNRSDLKVLATTTTLAGTLATAGFIFPTLFPAMDASATDGRGGGLRPLTVLPGTIRSVFDSPDGLFPGHSADITMRVSNPNRVPMTITSITPAIQSPKTVTAGTTPDDDATRTYCTDRLLLTPSPAFAVDDDPAARRLPPSAEAGPSPSRARWPRRMPRRPRSAPPAWRSQSSGRPARPPGRR
jgi:hypothetical protein